MEAFLIDKSTKEFSDSCCFKAWPELLKGERGGGGGERLEEVKQGIMCSYLIYNNFFDICVKYGF